MAISVAITDDGSTLLIDYGTKEKSIQKHQVLDLDTKGTEIIINYGKTFVKFDFTEISDINGGGAPSSAIDARQKLEVLLDNVPSGSGTPISETASVEFIQPQLTAPGVGASVDVTKYEKGTFQYKIALIDTSVNIKFEGSLDGTNFYNLDVNEVETIKTVNGTFAAKFTGRHKFVRFSFVSEAGGTTVTIDIIIRVGV